MDKTLFNMTTSFLIYMNDIGEIAKHAKIRLFADDTNVFIVSDDPILLKENAQNTFLTYLNGLQPKNCL